MPFARLASKFQTQLLLVRFSRMIFIGIGFAQLELGELLGLLLCPFFQLIVHCSILTLCM